jgi:hypothetical protein
MPRPVRRRNLLPLIINDRPPPPLPAESAAARAALIDNYLETRGATQCPASLTAELAALPALAWNGRRGRLYRPKS